MIRSRSSTNIRKTIIPTKSYKRSVGISVCQRGRFCPQHIGICSILPTSGHKEKPAKPFGSTGSTMVEMRGVEPLSENRSMRLSPGASSDQISLWTISDAKSDTGSHFVRDRLNGEPPMHGHRYMTFSLGSRYSRGERAAL